MTNRNVNKFPLSGFWLMVLFLFVSLGINVFLALHVSTMTTTIAGMMTTETAIDMHKKYALLTELDDAIDKVSKKLLAADAKIASIKFGSTVAPAPEVVCLSKKVCGLNVGGKWFLINDVVDIKTITPDKFKLK